MSAPLGLGVVGCGTLARRVLAHLTLPDVAPAVRVVAVCDPAPGRAEAMAGRFGIPRSCTTLEELLADPAVAAVTIATPIALHHAHGLAAIRAGKHVHFNKTMATTAAEATELIDAAAAAGLRIVASPGERLRPHVQRVRDLLAEGAIGTVTWAACGCAFGSYHENEPERTGDGPDAQIDPGWYFRTPGGGPLYDMTVYALHALTATLGSVLRVTAMSGIRVRERTFAGRAITTEADDNTVMLLDFGDGLFAFAYGTAAGILSEDGGWDPFPRFYGTGGSIVGRKLNGVPFAYPGSELAASDPQGDQWLLPHVGVAHRQLLEQHVFADVMQLVDWVREGIPSPVTAEHARHVIEIIEAAYAAAATGQTRALTTTVDGIRGGG